MADVRSKQAELNAEEHIPVVERCGKILVRTWHLLLNLDDSKIERLSITILALECGRQVRPECAQGSGRFTRGNNFATRLVVASYGEVYVTRILVFS